MMWAQGATGVLFKGSDIERVTQYDLPSCFFPFISGEWIRAGILDCDPARDQTGVKWLDTGRDFTCCLQEADLDLLIEFQSLEAQDESDVPPHPQINHWNPNDELKDVDSVIILADFAGRDLMDANDYYNKIDHPNYSTKL